MVAGGYGGSCGGNEGCVMTVVESIIPNNKFTEVLRQRDIYKVDNELRYIHISENRGKHFLKQ